MKKVMVFGTFDILHPGHLHMLREAKEYGDYLVVLVAKDSTVITVKGREPYNSEEARVENVKKLKIADKIVLGHVENPYAVIRDEKPNIIALGYDQKVFVDKLTKEIDDDVQIVRLIPHLPEVYKSSKIRSEL